MVLKKQLFSTFLRIFNKSKYHSVKERWILFYKFCFVIFFCFFYGNHLKIVNCSHSLFCFMENKLPQNIFSKLCFFNLFMFDFNIFNNKIGETNFAFIKWFTINIANCSLLLLQSLHFWMKSLFSILIPNTYKIMFW